MRIWQDAQGNLITDEQLTRLLAAYGSLSHALEAGDICLVVSAGAADDRPHDKQPSGRRRAHASLASFL